jgi:hypothetical protein
MELLKGKIGIWLKVANFFSSNGSKVRRYFIKVTCSPLPADNVGRAFTSGRPQS